MTKTLLFDIDGTLILSGGAGGMAFGETLQSLFGVQEPKRVPMHGRTDAGIIAELFEAHSIPVEDATIATFLRGYFDVLPNVLKRLSGQVLPGVQQLLEDLTQYDCIRTLLTGNVEQGAHIKLQHFGLHHFFHGGVFGDHHRTRVDLGRGAIDTLRKQHSPSLSPDQLVVIGDTLLDIDCARAIGCRVLGVATGGATYDELVAHGADWVVEDLTHPDISVWLCS